MEYFELYSYFVLLLQKLHLITRIGNTVIHCKSQHVNNCSETHPIQFLVVATDLLEEQFSKKLLQRPFSSKHY